LGSTILPYNAINLPLYYKYGKPRIIYDTPEPTIDIHEEKDEISPNEVVYDLENNQVIIPTTEEIIPPQSVEKRIVSRNVNNTGRRNIR
jgi:hypothetical protein